MADARLASTTLAIIGSRKSEVEGFWGVCMEKIEGISVSRLIKG